MYQFNTVKIYPAMKNMIIIMTFLKQNCQPVGHIICCSIERQTRRKEKGIAKGCKHILITRNCKR
jgi:hypothetical protein